MYVCALCACNSHGENNRALEPLELKLERVADHHVVLKSKHRLFSKVKSVPNY